MTGWEKVVVAVAVAMFAAIVTLGVIALVTGRTFR